MKTLIHYTAGIVFSLCLMAALLITSVEAVVYWTPGYFEKEYAKYNVTEAVDMRMSADSSWTHSPSAGAVCLSWLSA